MIRTEKERKQWNEYQRLYLKRNPEKVRQHRINAAINLLHKNGYKVTRQQEVGDSDVQ